MLRPELGLQNIRSCNIITVLLWSESQKILARGGLGGVDGSGWGGVFWWLGTQNGTVRKGKKNSTGKNY